MKLITGTYIKNLKSVSYSAEIPSSWEELDSKQFARIIEILSFRKADRFTISVSLLALLFGGKNFHILSNLPDELLTQLVPLTNFIYKQKPPVKNYFPVVKIKRIKHIAPADDLSNLGFGEWCFAHQYFIYYSLTQDIQWLDMLIATIYRPLDPEQSEDNANYNGDLRIKFNENLIERKRKDVRHIELHMKLAVLAWFTCSVGSLAESRRHVFPESPAVDPDAELAQIEPNDGRTWMNVFRELLGPKWGTPEQLKFTNAMFILDELEDRHIAFQEAKKS